MKETQYIHRYLARFIIEATTPLTIGSGENNILTDALVVLDSNGLPYIPGSSLAGVIRHSIDEKKAREIFGYQSTENSSEGHGSEIIFSDAKMIGKDGKVIDGLQDIDFTDEFYNHFFRLPIRQHVRINHRGVVQESGKFDEQIIFKGTRFCFEMEMLYDGTLSKSETFDSVLNSVSKRSFRIGGGSRKGFGKIDVIEVYKVELNLMEPQDLTLYLSKSSGLSEDAMWWKEKRIQVHSDNDDTYDEYKLILKPDNFFMFGSGMGDSDADLTSVKAAYIYWKPSSSDPDVTVPEFKSEAILIPGTSVKGAVAHRMAYYYNLFMRKYADKEAAIESLVGTNNKAVRELFGYEERSNGTNIQVPGNVLVSDLIVSHSYVEKILNHVAIDRFTGGAMAGALFSEKTIYDQENKDKKYEIIFLVKKENCYTLHVLEAFERALLDICNGMLPLGGGVNRGNGCFNGKLFMNGKELK